MMYHSDPPPKYEEFLFGPIPRRKRIFSMCPNPDCESVQFTWSPATGVLVCPYCNCRLIKLRTRPAPPLPPSV